MSAELLARLRAAATRDAAFAELFAAHRIRVFTVCRHLTRTRSDAEDATQETFIALLRAVGSFRGDCALSTFMHRIAVRTAVKMRRRASRHEALRVESETDSAAIDRAELWTAMEQLSVEHRTVLGLFAVEGLSHREIAAVLGVAEGTVWSRLHVAKKRLAVVLRPAGDGSQPATEARVAI